MEDVPVILDLINKYINFFTYRVSSIEVCNLKVLKNIENKFFFENTWAYFQVNLTHFDIHALPWRKIKRK